MEAPFLHLSSSSTFTCPSRPTLHHSSPKYKPKKLTMSHNQSYWSSINTNIETHLKQAIQVRPPLLVYEPMHHLVFTTPRTMAPALTIAACELVGGQPENALAAASALHLMYAGSFIHEHLPLTDRRMSKFTVPHDFHASIELLTGDGILSMGYELLAASSDDLADDNSERILRVIVEITRAVGSHGLVHGLYLQNRCSPAGGDGEGELVDRVVEKKEGGLYACGAACGAILGGGSEKEIEKLRRYGHYVGMIHGFMSVGDGRQKGLQKSLRSLALKELEGFNQEKVEAISSLVNQASFCNV